MSLHPPFTFSALLCSAVICCVGCGESAPSGSETEKLNMAPPLAAEVPEPAAEETAKPDADTPAETQESTAAPNVDLRGMTFSAPTDWNRKENPTFVEAEFQLPGDEGEARMTIMMAGGDKQSNIDRWIGQFRIPDSDKPSVSEFDVDGKSATMVDIRGTFSSQRPGQGPMENYRMLGFIIPFSASDNYFVKVTGPQGTVEKHKEAVVEFVKSGKRK